MLASLLLFSTLTCALQSAETTDGVVVTTIEGEIEEGMIPTLARAVARAKQLPSATLILELDTPGGSVDIMSRLGDLLRTRDLHSIAYVTGDAASAGAFLTLCCERVYTAQNAVIGSARPIMIGPGGTLVTDLDPGIIEKQISFLRAKFRDAAQGHDKPGLDALAQAFVDSNVGVVLAATPDGDRIMTRVDFDDLVRQSGPGDVRLLRTINEEGKLLALSAAEAFELGLSDGIVTSREELLEALKLEGRPVIEVQASWSERFVNQLGGIVRYVLFGLGILCLVIEAKTPGFGLFGILGLLLLGVVFFRNYLAGLADLPEVLLIILGVVLLAVELFVIPGFGLIGFLGIACMALGALFSFLPFLFPSDPYESTYLRDVLGGFGAMLVGVVAALFPLTRWVLPRLPWFQRMSLAGVPSTTAGDFGIAATVGARVGARGIAATPLRPSGKVDVEGGQYDARSDGGFIEAGMAIVIVSAEANHVVVRGADGEQLA